MKKTQVGKETLVWFSFNCKDVSTDSIFGYDLISDLCRKIVVVGLCLGHIQAYHVDDFANIKMLVGI